MTVRYKLNLILGEHAVADPMLADKLLQQFDILEKTVVPLGWQVTAYFDGNGSTTCKRPGRAQWLINWPTGIVKHGLKEFETSEKTTNNFLEYQGLLGCLKDLHEFLAVPQLEETLNGMRVIPWKETPLVIRGDSSLVVNQVGNGHRVNASHLIPLRNEASELVSRLKPMVKSVKIEWIPSSENLVDKHK